MIALEWSKLNKLLDHIPIADLGVSLGQPMSSLPLMGENPQSVNQFILSIWFKIGPNQYIRVAKGMLLQFAWAVSDGAFAFALTHDPFFEDGSIMLPPTELLPDLKSYNYQSIMRTGQESGDVHFYNAEWDSQRIVQFNRFKFIYRDRSPKINDMPICIIISTKIERLGFPGPAALF